MPAPTEAVEQRHQSGRDVTAEDDFDALAEDRVDLIAPFAGADRPVVEDAEGALADQGAAEVHADVEPEQGPHDLVQLALQRMIELRSLVGLQHLGRDAAHDVLQAFDGSAGTSHRTVDLAVQTSELHDGRAMFAVDEIDEGPQPLLMVGHVADLDDSFFHLAEGREMELVVGQAGEPGVDDFQDIDLVARFRSGGAVGHKPTPLC